MGLLGLCFLLCGWSPDSMKVLYGDFGNGRNVGLWMLDVDSGKAKKLLGGPYTLPRWSPDGNWIAVDDRVAGELVIVPAGIAQDAPAGSAADLLTSSAYEWSEPENLGPLVNSTGSDGAPTLSGDGLLMIFHSDREGGQGILDLWTTTRRSVDDAWSTPENAGPAVNSAAYEGNPTLSSDACTLIFESARDGGQGDWDLWACTRAEPGQSWSSAEKLGDAVNSASRESGPALSGDGLTLLFHSDRPGGDGHADLWMCSRDSIDEPWSSAQRIGMPISGPAFDGWAALSSDGTALLFNSNRQGGAPAGPLWLCTRSTNAAPWSKPQRLWREVKGAWSPSLSSAGATTIFFDSRRLGGLGGFDLWMSRRVPKSESASQAD
jgi:Tol biopolymer transport system component